MPATAKAFQDTEVYWRNRLAKMGDAYVGRVKENHLEQRNRINELLKSRLSGYYERGLDFGCGWGRFLPLLVQHCGHIWAVDILEKMLPRAGCAAFNVTPVRYVWPNKLPLGDKSIDLLLVVSVFHYWKDDELFNDCTAELKRVLKPKARVLVLDNAVDNDYHVTARLAEELAAALGLAEGWKADRVTINQRANDHWFIDGLRSE